MPTSTTTDPKAQWEMIKSKRSLWLFPLVATLFIIGSAMLVLVPQLQAINDGRTNLAKQKDQLERLVAKRQFLENISEAELNNQLLIASRVLPNDKPVFQAVGILMRRTQDTETILSDYSLTPGSVSSGSAESVKDEVPGELANIPVDFSVKGKFDSVYSLLTSLDNTAPLSRVMSMSLTGFNQELTAATVGEITAKLTAQVYYAVPPKNLGKASDTLKQLSAQDYETLQQIESFATAEVESIAPEGLVEQKEDPFSF